MMASGDIGGANGDRLCLIAGLSVQLQEALRRWICRGIAMSALTMCAVNIASAQ